MDRIPLYNGVVNVDTSNSPNALVKRTSTGAINVGQANVAGIANTKGVKLKVAPYTANATLDDAVTLITADATGGAIALTLPVASASAGLVYHIARLNSGGNAVTITANGDDDIYSNGAIASTYALSAQGAQAILWSDGTRWLLK